MHSLLVTMVVSIAATEGGVHGILQRRYRPQISASRGRTELLWEISHSLQCPCLIKEERKTLCLSFSFDSFCSVLIFKQH